MSANRTAVQLVAAQPVAAGAEPVDFAQDLALLRLEASELRLSPGERAKVGGNEGAERGAAFRRANPRYSVDVVGKRDGDILHVFTISQFHLSTAQSQLRAYGVQVQVTKRYVVRARNGAETAITVRTRRRSVAQRARAIQRGNMTRVKRGKGLRAARRAPARRRPSRGWPRRTPCRRPASRFQQIRRRRSES